MKITDNLISIPPYISASWHEVLFMQTKDSMLIVTLKNNKEVIIPNLSEEEMKDIFTHHANFLEKRPMPLQRRREPAGSNFDQMIQAPLKILFGSIESIAQALQHNPAHKNLPALPQEVIEKIRSLAKLMPQEELGALDNPELDCMCMYCQMMRVMKNMEGPVIDHPENAVLEEPVSDEELRFEEWDISSIGEKMYLVTNKLDSNEQYTVYLGNPIGCTCGKKNCDHIVAVLRH